MCSLPHQFEVSLYRNLRVQKSLTILLYTYEIPVADKIVVGSFHGFLRIYNPQPQKGEGGWSGFKAEDVLCEIHLQLPILQVEAGRFVS